MAAMPAAAESPTEAVRDLLPKLLHESKYGRLGPNDRGQFKRLSPRLQQRVLALECDAQAAAREDDGKHLFPSSSLLFDRWDTPSSCQPAGHRTLGRTARVEVQCQWGPETDHQTGKLQLFFVLERHGGQWRLGDVVHGQQEDANVVDNITKSTFAARLLEWTRQSSQARACQAKFPDQP